MSTTEAHLKACPVAGACDTCGAAAADGADLAVCEADTSVGVICVTLCLDCETAGKLRSMSCPAAVYAVLAHVEHTGIDDSAHPEPEEY